MADRLQQKRILTDRLKEVISRYSNLLPEEQSVAGIKDISRKLGEFITTPAASKAWNYDELLKLDGPALFRKIHGAWGAGQRTNKNQLLIQPGSKQDVVDPFTGKKTKKDVNPGSRVHHKVQVASIWRSIEDLDTDTQLALIEALSDRAIQLGNDPGNIENLLDYTHEYAGDNAAHVWGDTKGAHFRVKLTPDMTFDEQLDALIETSIKPQYQDILRATAPGTVEYAYRQQQATDFINITGKSIDNATPEDRKKFQQWLNERSALPILKRDSYDRSLVNPENQRTRDIYETHYENVRAGRRSSGLGPLKGSERKALDKLLIANRKSASNVKPYLATINQNQPLPNPRSKEYKNLVQQARESLAVKTGYPVEYGMKLPIPDPKTVIKAVRTNPMGTAGSAAMTLLNDEVAQSLAKDDYKTAATAVAKDIALGVAAESVLTNVAAPLAQRVAPGPALYFSNGVARIGIPAAVGVGLFMQGKTGSALDTLTEKAATVVPGLKPNPQTDVGRSLGHVITQQIQAKQQQAKQRRQADVKAYREAMKPKPTAKPKPTKDKAAEARSRGGKMKIGSVTLPELGISEMLGLN